MIAFQLILPVLLLAPPVVLADAEKVYVYEAVLLREPAPISIDGDLSDWKGLDVEIHDMTNISSHTTVGMKEKQFMLPDAADLSATFRCLVDPGNFYVAVVVRDDTIIFGEEPFGTAHNDDSVEIYFDGDLAKHAYRYGEFDYDANDAEIRFSRSRDGKVRLEGMGLFGDRLFMLPGLWESLGIVAAIKECHLGYTAELKVPKMVFVSSPLRVGLRIGFNVMVNDDDNGGHRDGKISWTADRLDESWITTRYFGRLVIDREISVHTPPTESQPEKR